ncbi:hypothetical protein RSAG8_11324, partial [Rhizoctonia solani AG-8 WAC10335]
VGFNWVGFCLDSQRMGSGRFGFDSALCTYARKLLWGRNLGFRSLYGRA